jgi:hypothetical protein
VRLQERHEASEARLAEIRRRKRDEAKTEAERLERLAAFGGPNYDPLNKHKQEFLLVKVRAQQQFERDMAKRAEVRAHILSHPDLKAQATALMETRGVPRIKPPPIHDFVGPAPPPPDAAAAAAADVGRPKEVKQLSIWEETKFVTDRGMVEAEERAYERRKRQFCADLAACVRSVAARATPALQPTCASLFEVWLVRKGHWHQCIITLIRLDFANRNQVRYGTLLSFSCRT